MFDLMCTIFFAYLTSEVPFAVISDSQGYFYCYPFLLLFFLTNNWYCLVTAAKSGRVSNQLKIWGWWSYFLLIGEAPIVFNILVSIYEGVGLSELVYRKHYHLPISLTMLDAVARTYAIWNVVTSIW